MQLQRKVRMKHTSLSHLIQLYVGYSTTLSQLHLMYARMIVAYNDDV